MHKLEIRTVGYVDASRNDKTTVIWRFDPSDPMVYTMILHEQPTDDDSGEVTWVAGRQLFRQALDDHQFGGNLDVVVVPPKNGELDIVIGNGEEHMMVTLDASPVRMFHRKSHLMVTEDEETEITMNKLMKQVTAYEQRF